LTDWRTVTQSIGKHKNTPIRDLSRRETTKNKGKKTQGKHKTGKNFNRKGKENNQNTGKEKCPGQKLQKSSHAEKKLKKHKNWQENFVKEKSGFCTGARTPRRGFRNSQ